MSKMPSTQLRWHCCSSVCTSHANIHRRRLDAPPTGGHVWVRTWIPHRPTQLTVTKTCQCRPWQPPKLTSDTWTECYNKYKIGSNHLWNNSYLVLRTRCCIVLFQIIWLHTWRTMYEYCVLIILIIMYIIILTKLHIRLTNRCYYAAMNLL